MQQLKALIINCTLKNASETSNTQALVDKVVPLYQSLGVETEVLRFVEYDVRYGVRSDMGEGDQWPEILEKIKAADIFILGTPVWLGNRASTVQKIMERLDATFSETDEETGQYPFYNKVGGVLVTGNEDGAQFATSQTVFNMMHLGFTVPPNCDAYWVGEAGPGPSYIKAGGERHLYTNKSMRYLVHNTTWFARLLKQNRIPTNLNKLAEEAKQVSDTEE